VAAAVGKHARAGHPEGTLIMTPHQGLGRYTVMDHLATFLLADETGGGIESFMKSYMHHIGETIDIVGALGDVADYLVGHILTQPGHKIEREDDIITIDPLIVRAKRAVERQRRQQATA